MHICGDSCFKYSGTKVEHICRHGYYYIISLANGNWKRRRRGKQLRNALFVVRQSKYGMQGRVMVFQEHPFECALRCNFDVQDLRRVFDPRQCYSRREENPEGWLDDSEDLPHLGDRPDWGYMNVYEWDGETYAPRCESSKGVPTNCFHDVSSHRPQNK